MGDLTSDPADAIRLVAVSEFFAVSAGALAKTSIAITLLQIVRARWQRRVIWGLAVSANVVIVGFAVFLWVTIWNQQLGVICEAGAWSWRLAIFGAGQSTRFELSIPRRSNWAYSVGGIHRLRLCNPPLVLHLAPAHEKSREDWSRRSNELWGFVSNALLAIVRDWDLHLPLNNRSGATAIVKIVHMQCQHFQQDITREATIRNNV